MKKGIWISYDLAVKGDYPSLYAWLDLNKAVECGNSIAFIKYEFKDDLVIELKKDLESKVNFTNGDRVYVIYSNKDDQKIKGTFIRGGRKSNPWTGYAPDLNDIIDSM
ncbi:MAG TPA: hypothetical protein VIK14_04715 [Ignavibacteria bacterium]